MIFFDILKSWIFFYPKYSATTPMKNALYYAFLLHCESLAHNFFSGQELSKLFTKRAIHFFTCLVSSLKNRSVSGSTKLYKVHICYENLSGSMKSALQVHNEMKTLIFQFYLVYAYILRIFKIKVCGFSFNVKVKFHSNIQKQNFYKKSYTQ